MTAFAGITAERGNGWSDTGWDGWHPIFQEVADQAAEQLEVTEFFSPTTKAVQINRVKTAKAVDYIQGFCNSPSDLRINVLARQTGRNISGRHVDEWSATTLHEAVHGIRMEHAGQMTTPAESAATEALAYLVEDDYVSGLCTSSAMRIIDRGLLTRVLPDEQRFTKLMRSALAIHSRSWLNQRSQESPSFSNGELYGMQKVHYQTTKNGLTYHELMTLPPLEVLGV